MEVDCGEMEDKKREESEGKIESEKKEDGRAEEIQV